MHAGWPPSSALWNGSPGIGPEAWRRQAEAMVPPERGRSGRVAAHAEWAGCLTIERHRVPPAELAELRLDRPAVILHLGPGRRLVWTPYGADPQRTFVAGGSLSLLAAGTSLAWSCEEASETLIVAVEPGFAAALSARLGHGGCGGLRNLIRLEDAAVSHILGAVQLVLQTGGATGGLYQESLATALVSHLLAHYAAPRPAPVAPMAGLPPAAGLPAARLRRVLAYIETHLGEDTSIRQLAELTRLGPDHFAALFRQSVGMPPHRYVLERRAGKARELLAEGLLSLAEIGLAVGYASQPHFITMFRRQTGMTPGMYRKACRQGGLGPVPLAREFVPADSRICEGRQHETERRRSCDRPR